MSRIAYVNGQYRDMRDASVNIEDRGYQFSDGVYEVCEIRNGKVVDMPRHLTRLQRSLRELRIDMPMPLASLEVVIHETVRRNRVNYGIVYLQVTRGACTARPCISCQSGETCIGGDCTRFEFSEKSGHGIEGYWCHHHSRKPLAACRHQVRVTIAERARYSRRVRTMLTKHGSSITTAM